MPDWRAVTNVELRAICIEIDYDNIVEPAVTGKVVAVWKRLFEFFTFIDSGESELEDIHENWYIYCDEWIEDFITVHTRSDMRIYNHILLSHGLDFYERFGKLRNLSNQGFEASNGRDVSNFHRSTQKEKETD